MNLEINLNFIPVCYCHRTFGFFARGNCARRTNGRRNRLIIALSSAGFHAEEILRLVNCNQGFTMGIVLVKNQNGIRSWLGKVSVKLLGLSVVILGLNGCSTEAGDLKKKILSAAIESKAGKIEINLSNFLKKEVTKVCIQRQYMMEEWFVEFTNSPAPGFEGLSRSGEYVLWVYIKDDQPIQIHLTASALISPARGEICSTSGIVYIEHQVMDFN